MRDERGGITRKWKLVGGTDGYPGREKKKNRILLVDQSMDGYEQKKKKLAVVKVIDS